MNSRPAPSADVPKADAEQEPGYAEWKRTKIEKAIAQADKGDEMIPADRVWRDLGLER